MDNAALDELERVARAAMSYALPDGPVSDDDVQRYAAHHRRLPEARFAVTTTFDPPTILALITAARRPALPDREAVARIIAPGALDEAAIIKYGGWARMNSALAKADAILALLSAAPKEGE